MSLGIMAGLFSSFSLGFNMELTFSAIYSIMLSGWVLTALAIGFGSAYPNMAEDNPARIAVGFGGTLNFFASAIVVLGLILVETSPYIPHFFGQEFPESKFRLMAHVAALIIALTISSFAVRLGERSISNMEL